MILERKHSGKVAISDRASFSSLLANGNNCNINNITNKVQATSNIYYKYFQLHT